MPDIDCVSLPFENIVVVARPFFKLHKTRRRRRASAPAATASLIIMMASRRTRESLRLLWCTHCVAAALVQHTR